ncbi:MAG TPA: substrate-binding domain-containing protein, partial [Candidatus Binatia bacterium]
EGDWLGPAAPASTRVKAIRVGRRVLVQPVAALGGPGGFAESADGLLAARPKGSRAEVLLLRDRRAIDRQIVVAGCNPAMFLAADYLKRRPEEGSLLVRTMGSEAAFAALARGEAHVAGLHILDERSGESNLPYLRRNLKRLACLIVTFAAWEQGLIVAGGNPKRIRAIDDLARRDVRLLNRETGSGARRLLDRRLARAGIESKKVRGYDRSVGSHLDIAWGVREGLADAGIGVAAAAVAFGLDFVPLQEERYDLVIPTEYMDLHPALAVLLDTITSRPFRSEVEAMGGYDTREAGKVVEMNTQEQR